MKFSNRLLLIVGGVMVLAVLLVCLFLPKDAQTDPNHLPTDPTGDIHIQNPTDPTEKPPVVIVPDDGMVTIPTEPADPTLPSEGAPFIEGTGEEKPVVKDPSKEEDVPGDKEISVGKDENESPDVEQGEVRNDVVLEEKEEHASKKDEDHEDVIVEEESSSTGEGKGEVVENAPGASDDGGGNKNGDDYQPPAGGDNPFDDDTETDIEDTPVEDLIGDDEERPGEGIHF